MRHAWLAMGLALAATTAAVAAPRVGWLQGDRRVLIVSGPPGDPGLAAERSALEGWRDAAQARDLVAVMVEGDRVQGAADAAAALRARYALPAERFALVLVGKDGHVAYRAGRPVSGAELQRVIDAMPMRRAGQR